MTIDEYQALAMRTSPEGHNRVLNGCMGLIGESGEIVDIVKKWLFQSGDHATLPREHLIEECGDVLWYCAELTTGTGDMLSRLFPRYSYFFNDIKTLNMASALQITSMRLAAIAVRPALILYGNLDYGVFNVDSFAMASVKAEIIGIITTIQSILELHCGATLEDAMERNIEKLKRRYPDGFDPERSLHRTE